MANHLAVCHLSTSKFTEYEVILARAGVFRWTEQTLANMSICPQHRDRFGKYWRAPTSCRYPIHQGKAKTIKAGRHVRVINREISRQIVELYGVTVPIGSRKCIFIVSKVCLRKHAI